MVEVELHGGDRGGQRPPRGLMALCGNQSARADQKDLKIYFCILHQYLSAAVRGVYEDEDSDAVPLASYSS